MLSFFFCCCCVYSTKNRENDCLPKQYTKQHGNVRQKTWLLKSLALQKFWKIIFWPKKSFHKIYSNPISKHQWNTNETQKCPTVWETQDQLSLPLNHSVLKRGNSHSFNYPLMHSVPKNAQNKLIHLQFWTNLYSSIMWKILNWDAGNLRKIYFSTLLH